MARGVRNFTKSANGSQEKRPQMAHTRAVNFYSKVADWMSHTSDAPIFHPTQEEWEKPMAFIRSIRPQAERHGICKIIPPTTSTVPASRVIRGPNNETLQFHVRHQPLTAQPVASMEHMRFETSAEPYDMRRYSDLAYRKEMKLFGAFGGLPENTAEAEYWRRRGNSDKENHGVTHIEYGNDVEGTAFCDRHSSDPLGRSPWNMRVLPKVPGSTLQLLDTDVPGVSTPMLYIGMVSATFAWHVEDHYLYSINYQHQGAAKTWYGVASCDADAFEKACEQHVFQEALAKAKARGELKECDSATKVHSTLLEKTTMFSPEVLVKAGVPVSRTVQRPGEFVVTFPRAYHAGFSHGFSIGEAVNFATGDWFLFGAECCERYRRVGRMPIVPHELLICKAATELYEALKREWLPECMDEGDARSLAGVFVDMVRQQHEQRGLLVRCGAQQLWKECTQLTDCCRCKRLSYITVALDNSVSSGIQETLCLDCAVAREDTGHSLRILCSRNIRELEHRAKYLEQHSLLKGRTDEWLRAREGRGMEEGKLYGRCPGVLPLPLPTQPFQWCKLPDIVDPGDVSRPFAFPKFPVLPAFGGCAPDVNPGLGTMQHFGGGPPRLIIKQRCGAVAAALLESPPPAPSQRSWQPEPPRACSMPGMQPAAQPGDPVMTSGRRQAQHAEHTALENDTEQYWQSAGVGPHSDPSDCRPPQPWQPNLPGSSTGNPESAAKTAQQQPPQPPPSASMAQKVSPSIPRKKQDKQSAAPGPAIQQEHMRNATHSWDPLAFMAKTKPSEPVPEPETPPEAEAPRRKQPTALQSGAGAKRKRSGPDEGKGQKKAKLALKSVAAPAKPPAAVRSSPAAKPPPVPAKLHAAVRSSVAVKGLPGELAGVGEAPGEGGVMHHRAVYGLAGSPGAPMLDVRDVFKAAGWRKRFCLKASVRDMVRNIWKTARQEAQAKGVPICDAPQAHRCSDSPGPDRFLLGLDHIRVLFFLSTQQEREMLEAYCGDLWPVEEMRKLKATPVKQEVVPSSNVACTPTEHRLVLPSPTVNGQPLGTDWAVWQPSAEAATAMAQGAEGALSKAFFHVIAQRHSAVQALQIFVAVTALRLQSQQKTMSAGLEALNSVSPACKTS